MASKALILFESCIGCECLGDFISGWCRPIETSSLEMLTLPGVWRHSAFNGVWNCDNEGRLIKIVWNISNQGSLVGAWLVSQAIPQIFDSILEIDIVLSFFIHWRVESHRSIATALHRYHNSPSHCIDTKSSHCTSAWLTFSFFWIWSSNSFNALLRISASRSSLNGVLGFRAFHATKP